MNPEDQLRPEEDAELRRLHMLRGFGMVAGSISSRYDALRGRDRRKSVRDPDEQSVATPLEKALWAAPTGAMEPVASGTQGVVGDSREIFGQRPEARRGLGIFRR